MTRWMQISESPWLIERTEPYLMPSSAYWRLEEFADDRAVLARAEIGTAQSVTDVIESLKAVLDFPDWCGSSWDSIEDAFEDIRLLWKFPLILAVNGLDELLGRRPQLGLQTVIRLSELSRAFSIAGDQLIVVYSGASWTTSTSYGTELP